MKIYGGEILIIGDLHFSDRKDYGKHKNYLENCFLGKDNAREEYLKNT